MGVEGESVSPEENHAMNIERDVLPVTSLHLARWPSHEEQR
jgi:hypothetical protein